MTTTEFETIYTAVRPDALRVITAAGISQEDAEDAVQNAAEYVLENLARFPTLTTSYFLQLCVNRARNLQPSADPKKGRRRPLTTPVGGLHELDRIA